MYLEFNILGLVGCGIRVKMRVGFDGMKEIVKVGVGLKIFQWEWDLFILGVVMWDFRIDGGEVFFVRLSQEKLCGIF